MIESTSDKLMVSTPIEELGKHVPIKALQKFVEGEQEASKHTTKESLLDEVRELVENKKLSIEQVSKLTQDYKYAGRVSVCWGIPLKWTALSTQQLEQIILNRTSVNPFEEEIRPQLTQKPTFNKAQWLYDDLLRLEFTYAGKLYEVEDNYQKRTIVPTKRISSYLRLLERTFVVETRASIRESKLVHDSVAALLGTEITSMTFSNQDIEILKQEISKDSRTTKRAAKHKQFGGEFDIVYVSASPELDDLDNSEEYQRISAHGELRETRLEFVHTTAENQKISVSLHVSNQGNIWFMSDVSEEIIDYVFAIVRKIKFLPPVRKLGLSSFTSKDDENKIQELLTSIHTHGYGQRFNPRIYRTLKFEIDERKWMEAISKFVQLGYLIERFELVCPFCHETMSVYLDYKDIPLDKVVDCTHCGIEFKISEQNVLLTYSFKRDFASGQEAQLLTKK